MNRFIIGQYGSFDDKKYKRDFKEGFFGIEACLFSHEHDIANLVKEAKQVGFQIGVHFPLRAGISKHRDAQFLSSDRTVRLQAYDLIQRELDFLATINPFYVLFHYPKPVILDERVDWSKWRFEDPSEYEYETSYSFTDFKETSEILFAWLSQKGREYNFTPILELDGLNKYIYNDHFFKHLLEKYSDIRLCLDTARLFLQDQLDPFFDSKLVIKKYARFADTIHLSNVQITDDNRIQKSRYPVLPNQNPIDGWAPIEEYLSIIIQENKNIKIMFEHRSDLVSDEELWECYNWVNQLFA
ncbi:DEAD/DEAH box helicase family protein [Rubeoparvulum massiliense]|uniref:hypothetical protein n=1 Tax=Rubeoparvulum massiliense TaxID=1631346 RepID=UPI00065E4B8A|nr:hypothetical protein [Rubeoparvulum massiliense]